MEHAAFEPPHFDGKAERKFHMSLMSAVTWT